MEPVLLNQLRKDDILKSPVWKFWYEDGLEKIVPVDINQITENSQDTFIVLTEFTFSNQSRWFGFCSPQDPSGLDYIQPVVITGLGQIPFYRETSLTEQEKKNELTKLGLSSTDVFPATLRTKIRCDNEYLIFEILDFESPY